jgi:hypothetical protein
METEMNITDQQAKASLEMIQQTTTKTKNSKASFGSPWLILWGALWMVAYTAAHFYRGHYAHLIFPAMGIIGSIGSGLLVWWDKTKAPVKGTSSNPLDKKILRFWGFLALYVVIWIMIVRPDSFELNVVIVTAVMFAYVVMGLFYEVKLMIILGIFVTAITLLAYFFFPHYYCLFIAFFGGGSLLGTGIYMRLMWR